VAPLLVAGRARSTDWRRFAAMARGAALSPDGVAQEAASPVIIACEAPVVSRRQTSAGCASVQRIKIVSRSIANVGVDQIAPAAIDEIAEAIDVAFDGGVRVDDRVSQLFAFDKVFRQLVERTIEICIQTRIFFAHAYQYAAFAPMIAVERKAGPSADDKSIRAPGPDQFVCAGRTLVENIMEEF
jgi:hypothetical protein